MYGVFTNQNIYDIKHINTNDDIGFHAAVVKKAKIL